MKDEECAEHIVRSSILKLLRDEESGSRDSAAQRAAETSLPSALADIWALRPKAHGYSMHFKA